MTTLTLAADNHTPTIAILANPMSGRDVRRLAARASNTTHEGKRDIVARVAIGADAMGVKRILVMKEAFQIASGALEMLPLNAEVEIIDVEARSTAEDSVKFIRQCRLRGCDVIVTLGGDGTNRLLGRTWPDACVVPLSTGTNNVFPVLVEATSAGQAAGLVATGRVHRDRVSQRCKLVHVRGERFHDIAVIDAVLLRRDHVGNYLPFDPDKMEGLVLTRAEPAAVGTSPIGGMLQPVDADAEHGLAVRFGEEGQPLYVPLSPGLFKTVKIEAADVLPFGETRQWRGPGVIALDGDRERKLVVGEHARVDVQRDGPWVIDVQQTLHLAAEERRFPKQDETT